MKTAQDFVSEVLEKLELGSFPSKAQQKESLNTLNRAWEVVRDQFLEQFHGTGRNIFWDVPIELHHATQKKLAKLNVEGVTGLDEFKNWASQLRDLREAVKATPIIKQPPKNDREKVEKLHRSLEEILIELDRMVEVRSLFKGLPISATPHMVYRDGRWYRRTFFYWAGKLTPLSMIMAAVEQIRENEEAKKA